MFTNHRSAPPRPPRRRRLRRTDQAGQPPPRDDFESFTPLARIAVLPAALAVQVAASAGLRNRVVHEHDEIDPARVYAGLQAAVRDVPEYPRHVADYLDKPSPRLFGSGVEG